MILYMGESEVVEGGLVKSVWEFRVVVLDFWGRWGNGSFSF